MFTCLTHFLSEHQLTKPLLGDQQLFALVSLGTAHGELNQTETITVSLLVICNLDAEFKLHQYQGLRIKIH